MRIPFSGVGYKYEPDDFAVVVKSMATEKTLTQGEELGRLESEFTLLMGGGRSFAVSNAASAIDLVARSLELGPGDEVIAPSHTYTASVYPFLRTGAKIVWADIEPSELVVSAKTIEHLITEKTKVVVAVDLYGLPVPIEPLVRLCDEKGIFLLSDSAQAIGGRNHDGTPVGSKSHAAVFSFQSHKNISTLGEGGLLWISDQSPFGERISLLRHNGHQPFDAGRRDYWSPAMVNVVLESPNLIPSNYCLGEVQSALGAHLLKKVERLSGERRARYERAVSIFAGTKIQLQGWGDERKSSHHLLPLRLTWSESHEQTNVFMRSLIRAGVAPAKQYFPLHNYQFYRSLGFGDADVPESDRFYMQQVSLPFQSWMSDTDYEWMLETVINAYADTYANL